jgi:hypothetical protein
MESDIKRISVAADKMQSLLRSQVSFRLGRIAPNYCVSMSKALARPVELLHSE